MFGSYLLDKFHTIETQSKCYRLLEFLCLAKIK
jgi:hypothetical protein